MEQQASTGTLRIYGCGGAGINIASHYHNVNNEANFANVCPAYVDTSRSNLQSDFAEDDVFVLKNVDGSGKVRKENHVEIANVVKQILLQIEPGDFNVVVFSGSGGSGSVIGPLIQAELLARKLPVVALVIGSDESIITAQNTLNTLKSLAAIAKRSELPVVMYYDQNDRERKRSDVDKSFYYVISALAVLASNRNRELDSKDIANWVQFSKTTSVAPQLAQLEVYTRPEDAAEVQDPIALASLYGSQDLPLLEMVPEYQCAGYFREDDEKYDQIHLVITIDAVPNIIGGISKTLERYENQRSGRVKQAEIVSDGDEISDTGLIL